MYNTRTLTCSECRFAYTSFSPRDVFPHSSDSGGSDSEDGSVSRRKKKLSRDKEKSRKAKKDKNKDDDKHSKGIYTHMYMYSIHTLVWPMAESL